MALSSNTNEHHSGPGLQPSGSSAAPGGLVKAQGVPNPSRSFNGPGVGRGFARLTSSQLVMLRGRVFFRLQPLPLVPFPLQRSTFPAILPPPGRPGLFPERFSDPQRDLPCGRLSPALFTACKKKAPSRPPLGSPRGDWWCVYKSQNVAEGKNLPERPREHPRDTS